MCKAAGRTVAAAVVDHVVPHRGDAALFWDPDNLQSLCKPHHDGSKQSEELRGYSREVDPVTGWPIDERHPSNRGMGGRSYDQVDRPKDRRGPVPLHNKHEGEF
jgi:hypothetical protein